MSELLSELFKAQPDVLLMLAGLVLIGIGVVGSIKTYIDPGKYGRIAALGIGAILLTIGVTLHARELTDLAKAAISPTKSTEMSSICTFDTGPLAGSTNLLPETQIGSVGGACKDAAGNSGVLVVPTRQSRLLMVTFRRPWLARSPLLQRNQRSSRLRLQRLRLRRLLTQP